MITAFVTAAASVVRALTSKAGLIVLAVAVIGVLALGWKCSSDRERQASTRARVSDAQAEAGRGAAEIAADQTDAEADSRVLDAANRKDILETDNADEDAGDAGRAGLRAICNRMPTHPDCRD